VPRSPIGIVVGCKYFKKWRTVRAIFTLRSAETRSLFYDSIKAKKFPIRRAGRSHLNETLGNVSACRAFCGNFGKSCSPEVGWRPALMLHMIATGKTGSDPWKAAKL
jgi:hypothetical protein